MRSETVQLQRTQRDYRRGGRKDTPLWEDKLKEMSRFNEKISAIDRIDVSAYTIPTDFPESDGTFEWDSTTLILVEAHGGGESGLAEGIRMAL